MKDWQAENRMNGSVQRKDADNGGLPVGLPTDDGFGRLT